MSQASEAGSVDEYSSADDEPLRDISEFAPGISYSSMDTIEAIWSYYQFLIAMYLDENDVEYPPEGGWPEITVESMGLLGKTDEVVHLLKRIPYVAMDGTGDIRANVAGGVHLHNWAKQARDAATSSWDVKTTKIMTESASFFEDIPASVIGLCVNETHQDEFLLDTALGLAYYSAGCPKEIEQPPFTPLQATNLADFFSENEVEWRDQPMWPIVEFFEALKHQFKVLNFVPIDTQQVFIAPRSNRRRFTDELIPTVRAVFHEHGWPDVARYDKNVCLKAVRRAIEDQHPVLCRLVFAQSTGT